VGIAIFAGGAISVASSFIFTKPDKGFEVAPLAGDGFYGITISKQW